MPRSQPHGPRHKHSGLTVGVSDAEWAARSDFTARGTRTRVWRSPRGNRCDGLPINWATPTPH